MPTMTVDTHDVAGNWRKFECFVWHDKPDDADNWAIFYTHNRDSRLLDLSNASVINKEMEKFSKGRWPSVRFELHNHWACGWVAGFSVRVLRNGKPTPAIEKYLELQERLEDYCILDESDYSERETEATYSNLDDAVSRVKNEFILPEDWKDQIYSWLSDSVDNSNELENKDDQGGYPSEESLRRACVALGFKLEE